jgi:hypothetical protein
VPSDLHRYGAPVTSRCRWLLAALSAWTIFVWGNRLSNAWSSTTESTGAKVVSTVLATSFLLLAAGTVVVLVKWWTTAPPAGVATFVTAFAGWTTAVWVVRIVAIGVGDHGAGFKVVHVALGLVSIALSIGAARAVRSASNPLSTAAV